MRPISIRLDPEKLAGSLSPDRLQLILMPTEACNFRCIYCYESFRHKRMEPWVVSGVKALMTRRAPGLQSLLLTWFGGEPLLALDIIRDLMRHGERLRREHPRIALSSDITTNGWNLTRDVFGELLLLGVTKFQISFDGPREWHDRKRVRFGGLGTYDRVWGNLCGLRDVPGAFEVRVRLHADRENVSALPRFIEEFGREFHGDRRFELFIRKLGRFGGPKDESLAVFEGDEGRAIIEELQSFAIAKGVRVVSKEPGVSICYAAKANSFLVRANGRINKCTLALDHPANDVGTLREDGTMEISSERMFPWMRGLRSSAPEELACPMKGLVRRLEHPTPARPMIPIAPST